MPLTAIAAPDGTQLLLCADDEWLGDFVPTGESAPAAGITGVDHVALTQPFDSFDEAALFRYGSDWRKTSLNTSSESGPR